MKRHKGAILITTLWILTLLTLLAVGIGTRMSIDIKLIGFSLNSLKAHYLAKAGMMRAITFGTIHIHQVVITGIIILESIFIQVSIKQNLILMELAIHQ